MMSVYHGYSIYTTSAWWAVTAVLRKGARSVSL